ncbi:MAG TPA: Ldh family oxidoreductase [Candidatus Methylomirabilis sp.]|nr:Ldh family oxidoreductase [Candidatus Methylomirabilis sp.]
MTDFTPRRANPRRLEQFVSQAFQRVGVRRADADLAGIILVDADLHGIDSHGVINLPDTYIAGLGAGSINPAPAIRVEPGSPTTASVDGDNGLGLLVSHRAMSECLQMAKEYGTGWATAAHSHHSGAGAYYVRMAVAQDMIGFHWSTGGSTVAAPGGKARLIGNNVMAFAAPGNRHPAFVLDMAPTMAIANKLHMLQWADKPMPEGWAIDGEGRPITDPNIYFALPGAILPLGSSPEGGVHKGFGLLLLIDVLSGLLSGDGGSMLRKKGEHCHAFCALRIDAFPTGGSFRDLMDEIVETLHAAPTLEGTGRIRYPGEREQLTYQERSATGIPLRQPVVDDLRRMSTELGLALDDIWET